jgi:hypothetical protein
MFKMLLNANSLHNVVHTPLDQSLTIVSYKWRRLLNTKKNDFKAFSSSNVVKVTFSLYVGMQIKSVYAVKKDKQLSIL